MAAVGAEDDEGAMGDVFWTYTDVVSQEESMDGWTCIHAIGTESMAFSAVPFAAGSRACGE